MKAIHNKDWLHNLDFQVVYGRKGTNFESNSQRKDKICFKYLVVYGRKGTNFESNSQQCAYILCIYIVVYGRKGTNFESNSQRYKSPNVSTMSCLRSQRYKF
ncbi:hypothetical protein AGMMS49965_18710 [Bacteroidia bacterium]|nr:hypothetical protein AGMMS49965_18710 [Bacteroidia bacterium]